METLLLEKDLDKCIVRPGENLPPEERRKDTKALGLIAAHVNPNVKTIVKAHGIAKGAWDALKPQNDTGMASRLIVLEQQLTNRKMEDTENVTDFCDLTSTNRTSAATRSQACSK